MAELFKAHPVLLTAALLVFAAAAVHFLLRSLNYRHNLRNEKPGTSGRLIGDQNGKTGEDYRFGLVKARGVACEVIAIHNAKLLLGMDSDLTTTIRDAQNVFAPVLFGILGTDVYAIGRILRREKVPYERVGRGGMERDGVYIVSFWNSGNPFDGIHTVCFLKGSEGHVSFNQGRGLISLVPPSVYARRFICAYYLGKAEKEPRVRVRRAPGPDNTPLEMY